MEPSLLESGKTRWMCTTRSWMYAVASIYVLTIGFNAWVEVFGPGDSGLRYSGHLPDHRPLEVERVVPGSALDRAGVRAGDVIEAVGGRAVAGQTDWFVVRAHFVRDVPMPFRVKRGDDHLSFPLTITIPNWPGLDRGEYAFQAARLIALALAIIIAFAWQSRRAHLAALIMGMIAVAEAFPPAGWAAGLRHLPVLIAVPIALASVSWLLIPVAGLCFAGLVSPTQPFPRGVWGLALAPVAVFLPLMLISAVAFIYGPAVLQMPSTFLDTSAIRTITSIWGVTPNLFINPWPLYKPDQQEWLLKAWVAISLLFSLAAFAIVTTSSFRATHESERRRLGLLALALAVMWLIAGHNVLVRNPGDLFGMPLPDILPSARSGMVVEAVAFSGLGLILTYLAIKRRGRD